MNSNGLTRIEALNKDNYDTWKMQMEALLIKNDAWEYVNGTKVKPEPAEGSTPSGTNVNDWLEKDRKARSDLILSISSSELKQIKGCATSREVWLKLESIYASKGPARKATLLKQLTLQRMSEGDDLREHLRKFFDAVDKLNEMNVDINPELLSIMLLYSLPPSFENFRCAIESRDMLPEPENLRVKIIEESEARNSDNGEMMTNVMIAGKIYQKNRNSRRKTEDKDYKKFEERKFKFKCHRCKKVGHKASECRNYTGRSSQSVSNVEKVSLYATNIFNKGTGNVFQANNSFRSERWCLDSGCTSHLCKNLDEFVEVNNTKFGKLNLATKASTDIKAQGTASILTRKGGRTLNVNLKDTLFVPDLRTNLLSVGKITDNGYKVVFMKEAAHVVDAEGNVKLVADRVDGLYLVSSNKRHEYSSAADIGNSRKKCTEATLDVWHRRLGHLNIQDLLSAVRNGTIQGVNFKGSARTLKCETCIRGKMTRNSFPKESTRKTEVLDLIHSDVCGPMRIQSNGKARYFVTFIDDRSRWCEVRFLQSKGDVFDEFVKFKALVETQKGKKVKCIQSDNGTEYLNRTFDQFLSKNGIQRRLTVAGNPEQNGVAERKNRTLIESARCLLIQSGLPGTFWAEAINTANYIRNRCPSKSLQGKTPYEIWTGKAPDVSSFKSFGCKVYCLDRSSKGGKFVEKSKEGIFLGYSEQSKGYRVWLISDRKVEITRDVIFLEEFASLPSEVHEEFFNQDNVEGTLTDVAAARNIKPQMVEIELITPRTEPTVPEEATQKELEKSIDADSDIDDIFLDAVEHNEDQGKLVPEKAAGDQKRGRGRPRKVLTGKRGRPQKRYNMIKANFVSVECAATAEVPLKEAMKSPEAHEWRQAIATELKSILNNDTWEIASRPCNRAVIGSRIVLRNKYRPDGTIERRKARIVARGFSQRPGIDFNDTFAPVARLSSIRLVTALAAYADMKIRQLDVATAYLNGDLEEEIYMQTPELLEDTLEDIINTERRDSDTRHKAERMLESLRGGDKVCLLRKALYGLRQAGRRWHAKLDKELRNCGAIPSRSDPCVYHMNRGEDLILIVVYVDDILVASRNSCKMNRLISQLKRSFEINDLGDVKYCLGLEFYRDDDGISIRQKGYILEILERFGMMECVPVSTPMDISAKLTNRSTSNEEDCNKLPYRELVGALMYLALGSRPDIAHSVSWLSQFSNNYGQDHWTAAKRVLRYLKGSMELGLRFRRKKSTLEGYVDADWGSCPDDRRSYTGYVFKLCGAAISWDSKKQRTVALSSTEAEYMALTESAKEAVYMRRFITELGFKDLADVKVFNDNIGAQKLADNPVFHARTKHIDIKHHFVREVLASKQMKLEHISTDEMAADILTKRLAGPKHKKCVQLLGLESWTT